MAGWVGVEGEDEGNSKAREEKAREGKTHGFLGVKQIVAEITVLLYA